MSLFWKIVLFWRKKHHKEELGCLKERFGVAGQDALSALENYKKECKRQKKEAKIAWLHAVSVGESLSVLNFVNKLCESGWFVVMTTTTTTSARLIRKKLPENAIHQYNPYPSTNYVRQFLSNWKPQKVFFVESEIFPNIVKLLSKSGISTYLLNARMSNRSFSKWKKIKFFIKKTLLRYEYIFPQNENEAEKFKVLTDGEAKIKCLGNMKFDGANDAKIEVEKEFKKKKQISPVVAKCNMLLQNADGKKSDKKIIVFSSLHESEFFHLVWQYSMILKKINCLAIFIPRYLGECEKLSTMLMNNDINCVNFEDFCYNDESNNAVIVDTYGVVPYLYSICDVAVVCGNFVENIGGHNPLEAIVFDKPTIVGQHCEKCEDIVKSLVKAKAIIQTKDLSKDVIKLLSNSKSAEQIVENGEKFIKTHSGATDKVFKEIFGK